MSDYCAITRTSVPVAHRVITMILDLRWPMAREPMAVDYYNEPTLDDLMAICYGGHTLIIAG